MYIYVGRVVTLNVFICVLIHAEKDAVVIVQDNVVKLVVKVVENRLVHLNVLQNVVVNVMELV